MLDYGIRFFYLIKPLIPRRIQITLRGQAALWKLKRCRHIWPIDERAGREPEGWTGWPDGKRFALVLTHDVDSQKGHDRCLNLAELEEAHGFRSAFNFVVDEYSVSSGFREELVRRGFEIGIHGLTHDGSLYHSRAEFERQATRINQALKKWNSVGFRAPCMYRNLEWLHGLDIEYDASTFDTDPFEPQPDGLGTIFPLFISGNAAGKGYVELPYTLPQDFTLFVLMGEQSIEIWKKKLSWIVEHGGLALINTHPDYMSFGGEKPHFSEYPVSRYEEFLKYVRSAYNDAFWGVLPRELARFWHGRCSSNPRTL